MLEFHPIADEWPLIEGAEFEALVASVRKHGVRVPGWKFEGRILDGRNRYRAATAVGKSMEWHEFHGTEAEARELAKLLNDERRHLSKSERAAWVAKLRAKGMSTRVIAGVVHAGVATVHRDLAAGVPTGTPRAPEGRVKGRDGKKYTATRARAKPVLKKQPAPPVPPVVPSDPWAVFAEQLAAVTTFARSVGERRDKPADLLKPVTEIEDAARALMAAAGRLRRV